LVPCCVQLPYSSARLYVVSDSFSRQTGWAGSRLCKAVLQQHVESLCGYSKYYLPTMTNSCNNGGALIVVSLKDCLLVTVSCDHYRCQRFSCDNRVSAGASSTIGKMLAQVKVWYFDEKTSWYVSCLSIVVSRQGGSCLSVVFSFFFFLGWDRLIVCIIHVLSCNSGSDYFKGSKAVLCLGKR